MKLRNLVVLTLALGACAVSNAQLTDAQRDVSLRILEKIRQAELYNQVLPVLMTPDQIKALLPIIEKHRQEVHKLELEEHTMLKGIEAELDTVIKAASTKGEVPDAKVLNTAGLYFRAFDMKRKALMDETVAQLLTTMRAKLNEGQVRSAANAFDARLIDPAMDPEQMTEDKRLDYWIRLILMDNLCYEVLLKLSQVKTERP